MSGGVGGCGSGWGGPLGESMGPLDSHNDTTMRYDVHACAPNGIPQKPTREAHSYINTAPTPYHHTQIKSHSPTQPNPTVQDSPPHALEGEDLVLRVDERPREARAAQEHRGHHAREAAVAVG